MKNLFLSKDPNIKTFLYAILLIALLNILMIPLYIYSMPGIPLCISIGMGINAIFALLIYLTSHNDEMNLSLKWALVFNITRISLLVVLIIVIAVIYLTLGIEIINPIAVIGGYFLVLILNIIFGLIKGKGVEDDREN